MEVGRRRAGGCFCEDQGSNSLTEMPGCSAELGADVWPGEVAAARAHLRRTSQLWQQQRRRRQQHAPAAQGPAGPNLTCPCYGRHSTGSAPRIDGRHLSPRIKPEQLRLPCLPGLASSVMQNAGWVPPSIRSGIPLPIRRAPKPSGRSQASHQSRLPTVQWLHCPSWPGHANRLAPPVLPGRLGLIDLPASARLFPSLRGPSSRCWL